MSTFSSILDEDDLASLPFFGGDDLPTTGPLDFSTVVFAPPSPPRSVAPPPAATTPVPPPVAPVPTPAGRRPNATYKKVRCSPAVLEPGAQYGFCLFCKKLLVYDEPAHARGERPTYFGRHRGKGKKTTKDCRGCDPAIYEQWRREDWEGAPRTSGREAPPPRSELVLCKAPR